MLVFFLKIFQFWLHFLNSFDLGKCIMALSLSLYLEVLLEFRDVYDSLVISISLNLAIIASTLLFL